MSESAESMVERVARAMHEFKYPNGNWPSRPWDEILDNQRQWSLARARAAIAAMREPTEEQYNALCATNKMWREMNSQFVWQTYIDAALKPAITVAEFHDTVITPFTNKLREP